MRLSRARSSTRRDRRLHPFRPEYTGRHSRVVGAPGNIERVPTLLKRDEPEVSRLRAPPAHRWGELIFRGLASGGSLFVLLLIGAIALFLLLRAGPALQRAG